MGRGMIRGLFFLALSGAGLPASAELQALDEHALSSVNARDGIAVDIGSAGAMTLGRMDWITDSGAAAPGACTGGVVDRHACTRLGNVALAGSGGPLDVSVTVDTGAGSAAGGPVLAAVAADWQPSLLSLDSLTLVTPAADYSARSIGSIGIRSQGYLRLANEGGLFGSGNTAHLAFSSQGDIVYRQGAAGSPELSFGNFLFSNRFTNGAAGGQLDATGRVGIDNNGITVSAPFADTDLLFDLMFKASPGNFDSTGREPVILFGWTGGLASPVFRLEPGGIAYGTYACGAYTCYDVTGGNGGGARSEGLNLTASWDFDSDFAWVLGQAGGTRTQVRFSNWRRMGPASAVPMLSMPITFDVLQNNAGPAGLCFGGGFASGAPVQASCTGAGGSWIASAVPAGRAALAVQIRDGHLHAYNQTVEVLDPGSALPYSAYNWSLVYTFGKLDADFHFFPEGRAPGVALATTNTGLKADITLLAQSPGYWEKANSTVAATRATAGTGWATNTHFLLADTGVGGNTAVQYGVGLVNADLLWRARDMYFRVIAGDSGYPLLPGGLWLQTDTLAQYRFRGMFGGGNLQNLANPTGVALMDLNLSANRFIFVLNPETPVSGDAPVGFNGIIDLDGSAYLSLAEVSSPLSSFRLYGAQGRIGWRDGIVNLVSGQNTGDGLPKLTIANDLLFGSSANFGDGGGAPFVSNVGFGSEYYGRIALPAGTWNSSITIKIPGS